MKPLSVLVDGAIYGMQRAGGVLRFTSGLISSLAQQQGLSVVVRIPEKLIGEPPRSDGVRIYQDVAFRPWRISVKYNNLAMECRCRWRDVRVYHAPYYEVAAPGKVGVVVTVHDMIHERFPELLHDPETIEQKRSAISRADLVVAVSRQTRDDLISIMGIPAERIKVIYHGIEPVFGDKNSGGGGVFQHLVRTPRYWLHVGCRRSYKNFGCLVQAFSRIANKADIDLVVIGGETALEEHELTVLREADCLNRVHLLGHVSDEQMKAAYSQAVGFVSCSLAEGFGFPVLESMACGTPVIVSDIPVYHEVAGAAGFYFDPLNSDALAEQLLRSLDSDVQIAGRATALKQAAHFSWDNAAKQYCDAYRAVAR